MPSGIELVVSPGKFIQGKQKALAFTSAHHRSGRKTTKVFVIISCHTKEGMDTYRLRVVHVERLMALGPWEVHGVIAPNLYLHCVSCPHCPAV